MNILAQKFFNMKNTKIQNFYNFYLGFLTVLVSLPVLAPVFLRLGLELAAKVIYFIYSFFCHQFATRSIHLYDFQYAWCSRDTGIWLGVALVAWLVKFKKIKPIKWYWVIPFVIPIALDGGIQTIFTMLNFTNGGGLSGIPLYSSNNFVRFLTGAFFGIGLSLWISGSLLEETESSQSVKAERINIKTQIKSIVIAFVSLIVFYIALVGLWSISSTKVLPSDFADSVVRLQGKNFFERRADGICPTTGVEDAFSIDCFF